MGAPSGFLRVAVAVPQVRLANPAANAIAIGDLAATAAAAGASVVVTPELSLTGYTCGDLFHDDLLAQATQKAARSLLQATSPLECLLLFGMPVAVGSGWYNCAVMAHHGRVLCAVPKTYIPNYNEFYERRWWTSSLRLTSGATAIIGGQAGIPVGAECIVEVDGVKVGAEICEDLWAPIPPSCRTTLAGAEVMFNLSASDDLVGKYDYLLSLVKGQSARCLCGYVYAGAGYGESSTDLVFDGKAIVCQNGRLLAHGTRWQQSPQLTVADLDVQALRHDRRRIGTFGDCAHAHGIHPWPPVAALPANTAGAATLINHPVDPLPFVPSDAGRLESRAAEIVHIQSAGLARRIQAAHSSTVVVGISGGLDSTLALLVAVKTMDLLGRDPKDIIGVTMPGFGTTDRTHDNALTLMRRLGVTVREVSIVPGVSQHFQDIGHDADVHDVTYENSQARYRTMLLMNIANQTGGLVLGTGDLSELALGWATYNGDHMSMYGVNATVPKTLVRYIVGWFASSYIQDQECQTALKDVMDTPISPELIPASVDGTIAQRTEDLVGPYELHDFFLYHLLRYGRHPRAILSLAQVAFEGKFTREVILKWLKAFLRRFFAQQFKRSCLPDGPKVGSVCLSPRGDWRMPSDATVDAWLEQLPDK